jgi:hypothetical protein
MSNNKLKLQYEFNELASKRQKLKEVALLDIKHYTGKDYKQVVAPPNDYETANDYVPNNENYYWDDDQNENYVETTEELFIPEDINPIKYKDDASNLCKFKIFCLKEFPEDNQISSQILSDILRLISRIFWYKFPGDEELNSHDYTDKTVGYVMRSINRISKVNNLTNKVQAEILNLMKAICPESNNLASKKLESIDSYEEPTMLLKFDICPTGGCEVFYGNSADTNCCRKCDGKRFKACTNKNCIRNKIENSCNHTQRPVMKQLYYKPFIGYLSKLLANDIFISLISFKFIKNSSFDKVDIMEGESAKRNMAEMIEKYNNESTKKNWKEGDVKPINILCSMFFDGVQVYKSKVTPFWPLFITILNLPPSFRSTPHAGIFLSSIFTCKCNNYYKPYAILNYPKFQVSLIQKQKDFFSMNACLMNF